MRQPWKVHTSASSHTSNVDVGTAARLHRAQCDAPAATAAPHAHVSRARADGGPAAGSYLRKSTAPYAAQRSDGAAGAAPAAAFRGTRARSALDQPEQLGRLGRPQLVDAPPRLGALAPHAGELRRHAERVPLRRRPAAPRQKERNEDVGAVPRPQRLVAEEAVAERPDVLEAGDDRAVLARGEVGGRCHLRVVRAVADSRRLCALR